MLDFLSLGKGHTNRMALSRIEGRRLFRRPIRTCLLDIERTRQSLVDPENLRKNGYGQCPADLTPQIGIMDDIEVQIALALAEDTEPETLKLLAQIYEPRLRQAVAQNANTPPDLLLEFAFSQEYGLQQALLENAAAPIEVLERLLISQYPEIRELAQQYPRQPADHDQRQQLVENQPGIPILLLEQFADDPWEHVRCWVAQYPDTPTQVLERLVTDDQASVVAQVLRHPHISDSVLVRYVQGLQQNWQRLSRSQYQRSQVMKIIQHPCCSDEVLRAIVGMTTLQTMHNHDISPIQLAILQSKQVPPELLRMISTAHYDMNVSIALTEHPQTPQDVLIQLWTRLSHTRLRRDRHDRKLYRKWRTCLRQISEHPNLSAPEAAMIRDYLSSES